LHGELPHRDYIEIYTGGLAYLHSFAFRYLGETFATPRIVLFAIFLAWFPVFYWIAGRFVSDWIAAGVTLLAIAWSLPNYSAAVAAILLFREQHCRWSSSRERFRAFLRMSVPFGAGALLPVLTFLIPYVRGNGVHALVNGLFVLPYKRLQGAYLDPPELATI